MVTIEKYVLGIDAAWTVKNPSGVALLKWFPNSKPELVRAGRSYDEFCNIGKPDWQNSIGDSKHNLDFVKIIECCNKKVDLVALDMPLSPQKITGRRKADDVISREYRNRKVSTHSPSSDRPGDISTNIFKLLTQVVPILVPSWKLSNILLILCRSNQPHIRQIDRATMTIPSIQKMINTHNTKDKFSRF